MSTSPARSLLARIALAVACVAAVPQLASAAASATDAPAADAAVTATPMGTDTSTPATDPNATVTPQEPGPVVVVPETPATEPAAPPVATEPTPAPTDSAYAPPPVEPAPVPTPVVTAPATNPAGTADPIAASKALPVSGPDIPAPADVTKAVAAGVTTISTPASTTQATPDRQAMAPAVSGSPDRLVIKSTTAAAAATPDSRVATDTRGVGGVPANIAAAGRTPAAAPTLDTLGMRLTSNGRDAAAIMGVRTAAPPTVGRKVSTKNVPSFLDKPTADPGTQTRILAPAFGAGSGESGSGFLQVLANYVFPGVSNNASGAILLLFPLALLMAALTPRIPRLHLQTVVAQRGSGCPGYNPVQLRPG